MEQNREHIANKIARDAISSTLKEYKNNFPNRVIPYEISDSWVETKYDAVGEPCAFLLTIRTQTNTYNKDKSADVYFKVGYQTNATILCFKIDDLVSDIYKFIKNSFESDLKKHKLFINTGLPLKPGKPVKINEPVSNLLLLL